ncbi:MAG: histidine phosphatase family protein [Oscillospiraceae bacterium]|nr:histidine phosphatase family protein [Oscillospiraceae bacterium]
MKKLYVTRHGLTEFNASNRVCGASDISLTAEGFQQAEEMAKKAYAFGDIERIIASPMLRARQTAQAVSDRLSLPIETDDRLREWNYGSFEGKSRLTDGFKEAKQEFGCKMPDGGESVFQLVYRTYSLLEELKTCPKNTILVCHGGVARVIDSYFHDMTIDRFMHFFLGNCEIKIYEIGDTSKL